MTINQSHFFPPCTYFVRLSVAGLWWLKGWYAIDVFGGRRFMTYQADSADMPIDQCTNYRQHFSIKSHMQVFFPLSFCSSFCHPCPSLAPPTSFIAMLMFVNKVVACISSCVCNRTRQWGMIIITVCYTSPCPCDPSNTPQLSFTS